MNPKPAESRSALSTKTALPANSDVVLIVDDVPDNLAVLHDALDESGFTVLVATAGEAALQRAAQALPDIVLLDAMMPGMDGFEVARRLKANPLTTHIPIIFMTGLTETEYLVAALEAGGIDYVTKPIKPKEVLARMNVHLQGARRAKQEARQAGQARNALDAFGYASITVRVRDGKLMWQTALARELLRDYFGAVPVQPPHLPQLTPSVPSSLSFAPPQVMDWLRSQLPGVAALADQQLEPPRLNIDKGSRRLSFRLHQQTGDNSSLTETSGSSSALENSDWLIIMREVNDAAVIEAMSLSFKLTTREAEVLYWVIKGKTNKDIGDILGSSPATAKKHLERIYVKMGVETRTAAAGMAMSRIRQLHPQFEG